MNPTELSDPQETPEPLESQLSVLAERSPQAAEPALPLPSVPAPDSAIHPSWLRLGYALEFFLALIAILTLWSEIGGEAHLEMMTWYVKLGCITALAWCSVRLTASLVEQQKVWTARTVVWLAGILLCVVLMGAITYYYHLQEAADEDADDDTTAAAVIDTPANHHASIRIQHRVTHRNVASC